MADFNFQPVASQVKPVPQMSLGDMMNLARGAQQYQQAEQINPLELQSKQQSTRTGEIALGLEEQKNKERLGAQEFFSNPDNFQTNGRIDMDKINAAVPKIAPLTGQDYISKFTTLGQAQTQAISAKQNLTQDQRALVGSRFSVLGRLGVQDKNAYMQEMDLLKEENPDNKDLHRLIDAYKTTWKDIPSGPQLPGLAISGAQTLLTPAQQQTAFAPTPGTVSTGARILPTVTTPSIGGRQPTIQAGTNALANVELPPGSRMVATGKVDMNNNPTAFVYSESGRLLGEITIPIGVPESQMPGAPQAMPQGAPGMQQPPQQRVAPASVSNAPVRLPAGETQETYTAAQNIRMTASELAKQVPIQQFNSNQIIKLADNVISGKGAQTFANLTGGYAGFNALGIGGENATNLQNLGHYMSQQTVALSQGTGLGGTDAGRDIARDVAGKETWTPQAIKDTARVNRALSTGTELFNRGVQAAFNKTQSPFAARDFQNKWSSTLGNEGIDAIRLYDLTQNKDGDGLKQFVDSLGGPKSPKYQAIKSKLGQMSLLLKGQ